MGVAQPLGLERVSWRARQDTAPPVGLHVVCGSWHRRVAVMKTAGLAKSIIFVGP